MPFPLKATFAGTGVAFVLTGTATQFYANFRLQPDLLFNAAFVLEMVYSDDISETDLDANTGYVVAVATATAGLIPAPNATMSLSTLRTGVDAKFVVKSATGNVAVTQGTVVAENYAIDFDTLGVSPTYATIDAAYNSATARVAMTGTIQTIPASDLNLVGLDLKMPKKRNVIVANIESGVKSYQLFQITFSKP